jgi:hypothetical protein
LLVAIFELVQALLEFYILPGALCKSSAAYKSHGTLPTTETLTAHVERRIPALAVQAAYGGLVKFAGIDVDNGTGGALAKAASVLRRLGLPFILSLRACEQIDSEPPRHPFCGCQRAQQ